MEIVYQQSEIDAAIGKLTTCFEVAGVSCSKVDLYGLEDCGKRLDMIKKFLFLYGLSFWNQNSDGTTTDLTNYWTQEELTKIISWINKNCRC